MSAYLRKAMMILVAFSLILLGLNAFAEEFDELVAPRHKNGDFTYIILENGTAKITKWAGETEVVSIPSILDGYTVTSIGSRAIRYPDVQKIIIPDSVVSIISNSFSLNNKLLEIDVSETNPSYKSVNGVLYTSDMKTLIRYPGGKSDDNYSVPEGTETIGGYAFYGCENLNSIVFPDTLNRVESYAFEGCKSIDTLTIPLNSANAFGAGQLSVFNNLKTVYLAPGGSAIPDGLFSDCRSILSITIPDGVQSIGEKAFSNCEKLQYVILPDTVTAIGQCAFIGCSSLKAIDIPDGVTTIEKSTFYECSSLESVVIPDSVMSINKSAFHKCAGLENVIFLDGVSCIGEWAFCECNGLSSVIIPGSVSVIDGSAFRECEKLSEVLMEEGVLTIGEGAFDGCSRLSRVSIPSSVKEIDSIAFYKCSTDLTISTPYGSYAESYAKESHLTYDNNYRESEISYPVQQPDYLFAASAGPYLYNHQDDGTMIIVRYTGSEEIVRIPDEIYGKKVTAIANGVFDSNERIRSVSIPDGITNVGSNPFSGCSNLLSIHVSPSHPTLAVINGVLFRKADKCLISYPSALEESTYAVPQGITKIGEYAFYGCNQLKTVTIPNSVLSIGKRAFQRCARLKELTIPNSVTSIGIRAFTNCAVNLVITVDPDSYAADYCAENQLPFTNPNANDWLFN